MTYNTEWYLAGFRRLIQKETISSKVETDLTKFYEFHDVLREVFPNVFRVCEFRDFEGSILLRWRGKNPDLPGIMFMNHHDVVEATGNWIHPPFAAEVADGKIWGRGTYDTKGGLYCMMQAAEELIDEGFTPERDIFLESTRNEETTGAGAIAIASWMKSEGIHLAASFDEGGSIMFDPLGGGDGTFALVGLGEKGVADIKFTARSGGGHASMPPKNTPLVRLGKFMEEVENADPFEKKISPVTEEMLRRIAPFMGKSAFLLKHSHGFRGLLAKILPKFSATTNSMISTTLAFTMAHGAEGANVLPQEAYIIGNMRFSHHEGRDAAIAKIKPIADKYDIEIDVLDPGFTSTISDYDGPAFKLVERAVAEIFPQVDVTVPYILTGASDSAYYSEVCDQSLRFLPFEIDDQQMAGMHGLNENLNVDSLEPAVRFYRYIMENFKEERE